MKKYRVEVDDNGNVCWYKFGTRLRHREDGPAVEWSSGGKCWYFNGELHREGGPAVEWDLGCKEWYLNGELHREDGPAIIFSDGGKQYWIHGFRHREDGPAVVFKDGSVGYYIRGKYLTEKEFLDFLDCQRQNNSSCNGKIVEIDGKQYKLIGL